MHIGFFHEKYPFGGGEKVTSGIIRGLRVANQEIKVTVFAIDPQPGADVDVVKSSPEQIGKDAAGFGIDVLVVAFSTKPEIFARVKAQAPGMKVVFHLHSQPMWQVRHKMGQGRLKWMREKLFGQYTRRYMRQYREIYDAADAIVTLCPAYADQLRRLLGADRRQESRITWIYNPAAIASGHSSHRKEVLYVGRMSGPDKRVDRLLRIWQQVGTINPEWKLILVGDGPQLDSLKEMSRRLKLKNTEFTGHTDNPDDYYSTASILCMTSDYEGWGLVLAEAMSYGLECIAFDCSAGVHELLADNRGVLIAPADEQAYAGALNRLISEKTTLSDPAPLLEKLTPEAVAARWAKLFAELCSKK